MPIVKIDETALEALKEDGDPKAGKVLNLAKGLVLAVDDNQAQQPYLIPIGERVHAVLERFDDRQITTKEALTEIEKLIREFLDARKEQAETGLDAGTYLLYREVKREDIAEPKVVAGELAAAFTRLANYRDHAGALRSLKAEIYKILLPLVGKERMVAVAERLLRLWKPLDAQ
jgi:type I restriction enzyme R subunit